MVRRRVATRNLGLVTGAFAGVVVVDVDDDEARAWAEGHLPQTPMRVVTGGGGEHRYYRHPREHVRNRVRVQPVGPSARAQARRAG